MLLKEKKRTSKFPFNNVFVNISKYYHYGQYKSFDMIKIFFFK